MWPYLLTFAVSCLFARMADYYYHNKKKAFILCSVLSVLLGAVLAGIRSANVGTDVMVYGNNVFKAAMNSSSPIDFISNYRIMSGIEPLYLLLNYVVSRFTTDVHWFYFVLQLATISLVYAALVEMKKIQPMALWMGMLVYYTLFYPFSLNGMRQALAMAIAFWALKYVYNHKMKTFFVFILIAAGFHYSVLAFAFVYPIYRYIEKSRNKKVAIVSVVMAIGFVAVFNQFFIQIISSVVPKYARYLTGNMFSFSLNPVIIRLPFIIIFMVFYRKYRHRNYKLDFWLVLLLADAILSLLRGVLPALYRLSLYFGMIKIVSYPYIAAVFNKSSKKPVKFMLTVMLFILWYYQIVIQGNEEVYPYTSDVLTWLK